MSDIFPKWTNSLPPKILASALLVGSAVTAGVWYYFTPKYTRVGYQPIQPVNFSHNIHAGQLGIDCRYCHNGVEKSWYSNIPAASTCMNCHNAILPTDARLALVRESFVTGKTIPWVQIHKTPDFVYFNHSVHVNRGVSCVECHGQVNQMDEVYHAKSHSMSFCLECHRDPAPRLRPPDKITDLNWTWSSDPKLAAQLQRSNGEKLARDWKVESLQTCSACHR
jgi:formate-dependent nitrite reductase cytochrome c552 subunit